MTPFCQDFWQNSFVNRLILPPGEPAYSLQIWEAAGREEDTSAINPHEDNSLLGFLLNVPGANQPSYGKARHRSHDSWPLANLMYSETIIFLFYFIKHNTYYT